MSGTLDSTFAGWPAHTLPMIAVLLAAVDITRRFVGRVLPRIAALPVPTRHGAGGEGEPNRVKERDGEASQKSF